MLDSTHLPHTNQIIPPFHHARWSLFTNTLTTHSLSTLHLHHHHFSPLIHTTVSTLFPYSRDVTYHNLHSRHETIHSLNEYLHIFIFNYFYDYHFSIHVRYPFYHTLYTSYHHLDGLFSSFYLFILGLIRQMTFLFSLYSLLLHSCHSSLTMSHV